MADFQSDEPFIYNHRQILISESINPIHLLEYRPEFYRIQLYYHFQIEKHLSADLPAGFETNISYSLLESSTTRVITTCYWEL